MKKLLLFLLLAGSLAFAQSTQIGINTSSNTTCSTSDPDFLYSLIGDNNNGTPQIALCQNGTKIPLPVAGPAGPQGPAGQNGTNGTNGSAATIAVGTVTSGTPAAVTNSGTSSAAVLNFTIPPGAQGPAGPQGPQGPPGTGLTLSTAGQGGLWSSRDWPPNASAGSTAGDALNSANQIRFQQMTVPYVITIRKIVVRVATAVASSNAGVAIYSADGTTKYVDSGNISRGTVGVQTVTLATPVTLQPGVYLVCNSADSATGSLAGTTYNASVATAGLFDLASTNEAFFGSAANTWSNTTGFPSSLGTLTAFTNLSGSGVSFPVVRFQP